MPYLKQEDRERLQHLIDIVNKTEIKTAEELNYLLTLAVHAFLNQRVESYQAYNDALGAIDSCKLELYRRHVAS